MIDRRAESHEEPWRAIEASVCTPPPSEVLETDRLSREALLGLASGRWIAISIRDYLSDEVAARFSERLVGHHRIGGYQVAPDLWRFGLSFYDTAGDSRLRDRYFDEALPTARDLRGLCAPYQTPIDRVRLEVDEVWPAGASVAELGGRKMFVGSARLFRPGVEILPHTDSLGFDAADLPAPRLASQFSANCYLQMPEEGGELELWWMRFETPAEQEEYRDPASPYGLDRSRLPLPAVRIRPSPGQLVVFDSTRIHAVRPGRRLVRISMSLFLGLRDEGRPILCWS